ncbi:MAG: FadR/GntR family transcriptional regulator [Desulfobacteraceae bacterium]
MTLKLRNIGRPQNLYMEAMQAIKDGIFNGEFVPGQALPSEKELAAILGVSRPVLREALRALQIQGFLDVRRGNRGGTYVTDLSNISIRDNLEDLLRLGKVSMDDFTQARILLEPEVFRLAALNATDEQLEELQCLLQKSEKAKDIRSKVKFESDFHRLVAQTSGRPIYFRFMQIIFDFIEVFAITTNSLNFGVHQLSEHMAIFEALKHRDGELAARLARQHAEKVNRGMIKIEKLWLQELRKK